MEATEATEAIEATEVIEVTEAMEGTEATEDGSLSLYISLSLSLYIRVRFGSTTNSLTDTVSDIELFALLSLQCKACRPNHGSHFHEN